MMLSEDDSTFTGKGTRLEHEYYIMCTALVARCKEAPLRLVCWASEEVEKAWRKNCAPLVRVHQEPSTLFKQLLPSVEVLHFVKK